MQKRCRSKNRYLKCLIMHLSAGITKKNQKTLCCSIKRQIDKKTVRLNKNTGFNMILISLLQHPSFCQQIRISDSGLVFICYILINVTVFHLNHQCTNTRVSLGGRRGHDSMVFGFTIIVKSVSITTNVVSSNPAQVRCYSILCHKVCQ